MEKNINVPLQALYYLSVIFVLKDSPSSWTRLQSRCELSGGNCDSKQAVVMCVSSEDNCLLQHLEIHTYQSYQLRSSLALTCLSSGSPSIPTCCSHLKASKCYQLEFAEISLDFGLLPTQTNTKRGVSLVCPSPWVVLLLGNCWLLTIPFPFPPPPKTD